MLTTSGLNRVADLSGNGSHCPGRSVTRDPEAQAVQPVESETAHPTITREVIITSSLSNALARGIDRHGTPLDVSPPDNDPGWRRPPGEFRKQMEGHY